MPLRPAAKTFAWFVLFCLLLEIGFRLFMPVHELKDGVVPERNETQLRNWPEYLAGNNTDDELLVYLGNSQAVGTEFVDASLIYPSIVRKSLAASNPQVHMENWSVSGLTAEQIELLLLQAEQRQARYVVMAVSMLNFDSLRNYHYGRDRTDIHLLTGKPVFWPRLNNTFIGAFIDWDKKLSALFKLQFAAGRARLLFLDRLAQDMDRRWQKISFGHARSGVAGKSIGELAPPGGPDQNAKIQAATNLMTARMWEKNLRLEKEPRLAAVYEQMKKRLVKNNMQLIWLWVPVGANQYNRGAIEGQTPIIREFCEQVNADGWLCENLSTSLAPEYFLPSTFSSHLNLKGHQAQAKLITPLLERVIH